VLRRRGTERRIFDLDTSELPDSPSRGPGALTKMLETEQGNDVRAALAELPDKFRVPLVLVYYNEMSYDEIAAALGLTRNLVATLIFRAKQQLRRKLQKEKYRGMSH
jgi:RNA polymerase sigma-70 factor (ECF subfamily)